MNTVKYNVGQENIVTKEFDKYGYSDDFMIFRCCICNSFITNFPMLNSKILYYCIGIVTSGFVEIKIDERLLKFEKNAIIFIPVNSFMKIVSFSKDCIVEGVGFSKTFFKKNKVPEIVMDIMESFSLKCDIVLYVNENDLILFNKIINNLQKRISNLDSHPYGNELLVNSLSEYFIEMAAAVKKNVNTPNFDISRKEELTISFLRMAKENYITKRNISFYGSTLSVTSKHLSETVKDVTGKTAGKIIDDLCMTEAKRLLEDTQVPISNIAENLNFSSPANFTRFFQNHESISPRKYRQLKSISNNYNP